MRWRVGTNTDPDSSLTRGFQRNSADVWRAVRKHRSTWGWHEQDWGGQCPEKFTFRSPWQSWRKANLLAWRDPDRNDARVALTVGLDEKIHDGLVDTLRKAYKQLSNPHEKAVVTSGMHTAASTRWGGTQEIVDDAGNMCCCPNCG